ncbi:MAG: DUF2177 family protein [bacterium]|nr:DUF2177 family protein [bacterium]
MKNKHLVTYVVVLLFLLLLDGLWIYFFMSDLFYANLSPHLASKISYAPVVAFYLIYTLGICFFVVFRAKKSSWSNTITFFAGAFFGLVAYATYDLTNQATLSDWPIMITCIDVTWGSFMTGIVALAGFITFKKLSRSLFA